MYIKVICTRVRKCTHTHVIPVSDLWNRVIHFDLCHELEARTSRLPSQSARWIMMRTHMHNFCAASGFTTALANLARKQTQHRLITVLFLTILACHYAWKLLLLIWAVVVTGSLFKVDQSLSTTQTGQPWQDHETSHGCLKCNNASCYLRLISMIMELLSSPRNSI